MIVSPSSSAGKSLEESKQKTAPKPDQKTQDFEKALMASVVRQTTDNSSLQDADRFDMTGVLGHSHAINMVTDPDSFIIDNHIVPGSDTSIDTEILFDLKTDDRANLSVQITGGKDALTQLSTIAQPLPHSAKPSLSHLKKNITAPNMLISKDLADGEALVLQNEIMTNPNDGEASPHKRTQNSVPKSFLNLYSGRAQSNPVMVALQSIDGGLRLYARVQSINAAEEDDLRQGVATMLKEHGFYDTDIVIDQVASQRNLVGKA